MRGSALTDRLSVGYAWTVFVSAFLLFQVQPLISRYILPWFGGSPAVWSTCLLFFQVLLFGGYAYAHLSIRLLRPSLQGLVHLVFLVAAVRWMPMTPSAAWIPSANDYPMWRIVCLLAAHVGLPYFLLSSTGPLLQAWFSRAHSGATPYRLYALSNVGSLLALLSYPFLVEPTMTNPAQASAWSLGFGLFVLLCSCVAVRLWQSKEAVATCSEMDGLNPSRTLRPGSGLKLLWLGLAACPSILLLATTNQVSQDVAVVPFLWVVPLSLYLVSFILCFDSDRWYSRRWFAIALAVSTFSVGRIMMKGAESDILTQAILHFAALFICSMVCHGELARLKPSPRYLTSFYLMCAAGGAIGGVAVALVAPVVFAGFWELHLGILFCCLLALIVFFRDSTWRLNQGRPRWVWLCPAVACLVTVQSLRCQASELFHNSLAVSRNFYGVLRVREEFGNDPINHRYCLAHGRILHGFQFLAPEKRRQPTGYYDEHSGIGVAFRHLARSTHRRVGVIGLGAGTLAAYAEPGDVFQFYEINPDVVRLANQYFTYLKDCPAAVNVVLGDARLSLDQEEDQAFDFLVLDAFSGDAIPAHLLTKEAFDIYLRHLVPDGVIAVHISNRHVDLAPVLTGLATHFGLHAVRIDAKHDAEKELSASQWVLLTASDGSSRMLEMQPDAAILSNQSTDYLWTDDFHNLFQIMKW